jgi:hypothetical protein
LPGNSGGCLREIDGDRFGVLFLEQLDGILGSARSPATSTMFSVTGPPFGACASAPSGIAPKAMTPNAYTPTARYAASRDAAAGVFG